MDQILHILKKDIRRLRWEIAASVLITMLLAWLNGDVRLIRAVTQEEKVLDGLRSMLQALSVFAWWFLIVSLMQEEAIPGVKQFWLTRPYRRGALLAAKIGFVLLFLNLPMLLADAIALSRVGIPLGGQLGAMLWKQVLYSITFLLPAIVVGAVTSGLAQAVLAILGMALIAGLTASIPGNENSVSSLRWWNLVMSEAVTALAGAAILWAQFFRRQTGYSRVALCVAQVIVILLVSAFPWRITFGWQQAMATQAGAGSGFLILPALERGHMYPDVRLTRGGPRIEIALPVTFRLPEGMDALSDAFEVSLSLPDGTVIAADADREGRLFEVRGVRWLSWQLDRQRFDQLAGRTLGIEVKVYATVFGRERKALVRAGGSGALVKPWGVCDAREWFGSLRVACQSAYTQKFWTRVTLRDRETGKTVGPLRADGARYSPIHMDLGISPLGMQMANFPIGWDKDKVDPYRLSAMDIELSGMEPLDHVIRTVRFEGVRLEDFTTAGRR